MLHKKGRLTREYGGGGPPPPPPPPPPLQLSIFTLEGHRARYSKDIIVLHIDGYLLTLICFAYVPHTPSFHLN